MLCVKESMTCPDSKRSRLISPARLAEVSKGLVAIVRNEAGPPCDPPANLFVPLLASLVETLVPACRHPALPRELGTAAFNAGCAFARLVRGVGLPGDQAVTTACRVATLLGYPGPGEASDEGEPGLAASGLYFEHFVRGVADEVFRLETAGVRKKLREANRFVLQERRRYFSIFKRMAEPAFIVDQDLHLLETNKAFDHFFMVTGREHIGEECYQVLGDEFRLACDLCEVLGNPVGGGEVEIDLTIQGQPRSIIVNGTFLGEVNHEAAGGIVIIQDITARRAAERALAERERLYRTLTETMPDATWRADQSGCFDYLSPNAFRIYGYAAEVLQGDPFLRWRAIHPDDSALVRDAYNRFFDAAEDRPSRPSTDNGGGANATIRAYDAKFRFQRGDGTWVWVHERANYLEKRDGRWCATGISSDITALKMVEAELERHHFRLAELVDERTAQLLGVNQQLKQEVKVRRQTEQALIELTARLSASNQELDQFAHVASHELKEPLILIKAFSERLKSKYADCLDGKGREYLARISAAAEHMRQLVDGFLALSQVSSGGQPYEEIDLNDLVQEVLRDLEARIIESNALIEIGNLGRLGGDRVQIRQLFQNIIANALKYSKPEEQPRVVLKGGLAADQTFYEILVQDNGIGFDPRDAERIFKPLERLHSRRDYEGTGMGLTTCQKIVARHGGEIMARGSLGQGATFIIRLPAGMIRPPDKE